MKKSPGMFSSIQMEYCHASAYDEWMPVKKEQCSTGTERNHQGYRRWEKQMQDYTQLVDELLEKECYIIDYLPETVPSDAEGQFWEVEHYLLNRKQYIWFRERFVAVILKIMCYCHIVILWNGWIDRPKPEQINQAVSQIMGNRSGTLNCVFPTERSLLTVDGDCLNLTVYHPSGKMCRLLKRIAESEGLFWRLSES